MMKAWVDEDECTGCGLCLDICPEVFGMDGEVARAKGGELSDEEVECAEEAADSCPVEAISVD
jgi:ferredoxin